MSFRTLMLLVVAAVLIPFFRDVSDGQVKKESRFKLSGYDWEDREIDGMKYRLYFKNTTTMAESPMLWVINLTKDRLECNKLMAEQAGNGK